MPAPLSARNGVELAIASMARQTRLGLDAARAGASGGCRTSRPASPKTFRFD